MPWLIAAILSANPHLPAAEMAQHMVSLPVPPRIMEAMIYTESEWNPRCRGTHGEVGLCQILPMWHPPAGWSAQMDWAAKYLAGQNHDSWRLRLADYNGGPGGHRKARCLRYADRVLRRAKGVKAR